MKAHFETLDNRRFFEEIKGSILNPEPKLRLFIPVPGKTRQKSDGTWEQFYLHIDFFHHHTMNLVPYYREIG